MTTKIRTTSGARLQGLAATAEKSSRPRKRFPHDGIGSITPKPSMLKVASVSTKTGIEIQNWASNTGRKVGMTWRKMIRHWLQPLARASNKKSESRMFFDVAQTTRNDEGHPSTPSKTNVATTDRIGEISIG